MNEVVDFIRDRHSKYRTCHIVGKGPSLAYLTADYFEAGPVITINDSILLIQNLGLKNQIYSLQKDGCGILSPHDECVVQPPNYMHMIAPKDNVPVFLQQGYGDHCLHYYPNKYYFNIVDFGFVEPQTVSLRIAIGMAKLMGTFSITLFCCDSFVTDDLSTYDFGNPIADIARGSYTHSIPLVRQDLREIPHSFIIPGAL